jgi:iron-sulfur cluster repair protein YtfE (RIC family)
MQTTKMKPSEVRARVLGEHSQIRYLLAEVESLAESVLRVEQEGELLHAKVVELYRVLYAHMSMEDELLYPAIYEADAWGFVRAARMKEEHAGQRAALSRLADLEWRDNTVELGQGVQSLAKDLREDMCREESELLNPDLLRDDVISIGQNSG